MMEREQLRLSVLKNLRQGLINRRQAAHELGVSERHIRRLLTKLQDEGDQAVIHGLRGRRSPRKLSTPRREEIVKILSGHKRYGPTEASEYLASEHGIQIGREALRQLMIDAGLWPAKQRKCAPMRHEQTPDNN
jgi:transposase